MQTLEGQCQCGAVRYRVHGEVLTVFACHCRECQRQSASAFGMALWLRAAQLMLLQGAVQRWQRATPSGRVMDCDFCPQCGTTLSYRTEDAPDEIDITAATLDQPELLVPEDHTWTDQMLHWVRSSIFPLLPAHPRHRQAQSRAMGETSTPSSSA